MPRKKINTQAAAQTMIRSSTGKELANTNTMEGKTSLAANLSKDPYKQDHSTHHAENPFSLTLLWDTW
eukprot:c14451_g1_i1 orf=2-205(-)